MNFFAFNLLASEVFGIIVRSITGRLYTDEQIKSVTSGAVGKYFAEFFPTPKEEIAAQERVGAARRHIEAANSIIRDMQEDLEMQDRKLGSLLAEVEQKRQLADRYQALAHTNQAVLEAFQAEMRDALRDELLDQDGRGKRIRQLASAVIWLSTLVIGAGLGAYFKELVTWFHAFFPS